MAKCAAKKALTVYSMPVCLPQREHRILLCWGSFFSAFVFGRWAFWGPESGPIAAKTNDVGRGEGDNIFLARGCSAKYCGKNQGKLLQRQELASSVMLEKKASGG